MTLLVNPEQAERLALASTEGRIQLALRNPLDNETPTTPGIRTASLLGAARTAPPRPPVARTVAAPSPPPPPPPPPMIEVIKGDKREHTTIG